MVMVVLYALLAFFFVIIQIGQGQLDRAASEVKRLQAVNEALAGSQDVATAVGAAYLELLHARGCPVGDGVEQ